MSFSSMSAPPAAGRCAKTVGIFVLDFVSRCITAVLPGPSVRILVCHPEPSESRSITSVCRAFRGTGPLPSSLFHFLRQCPLRSKQACLYPKSLPHSLFNLVVQMVKNLPAMQETGFNPGIERIPWSRKWQPTPVFLLENSKDRGAW